MDILLPIYKHWCDKILNGTKTIEFRTRLPKHLKQGTIIYLYETAKNGGCKKVVGQCEVDYIIPVLSKDGKWPIYGAYPFIDYFYKNIKKDNEIAEYYKNLKKEFDSYRHYRYGFILGYAFSELELESLRKNKCLIDLTKTFDIDIINQISKDNGKSHNYIEECDKWLSDIGYYNDSEESYYKFGIVLKNVQRFETPKKLSCFKNIMGETVKNTPQSYMYVVQK